MKVGEIVEVTPEPGVPSDPRIKTHGLILRTPNKVGMVLVLLASGKEHYCHISNLKTIPRGYLIDV